MKLINKTPYLWYTRLTRRCYNWIMNWSEHPRATTCLYGFAALEAFIFPIPVDPLLVALGAAKPKAALRYGILTTVFSVLGGLLGYAIGFTFWEFSQDFFFNYVISPDKFNLVIEKFQENAMLTIFLAGLTPIPFKVFTIAGGVAHIALLPFIVGSLLGRSLRFVTIGVLFYFFGSTIKSFIEKHFEKFTTWTGALVIVAVIAYYFFKAYF